MASTIKASGVPYYKGIHVPLASTFSLEYIKQEIQDYHDQILLDYLTFGFPLGLNEGVNIPSNATDNHASANQFPEAVDDYIVLEKQHGALVGPLSAKPHKDFTWSPSYDPSQRFRP